MNNKIIILIKLIIATTIFYAFLAFNIFHLGEILVPSSKDYLQVNIPQTDQNLEQNYLNMDITPQVNTGIHWAAPTASIDNLCASMNICDKITFNGTYTNTSRYTYLKIITKIIQFIDTNGNQNKKMENVLQSIQINNNNGNRRWYATHNNIIFNLWSVQSNTEFINLTTHEMGHITDLGYIEGTSFQKDPKYTEFWKAVFSMDDLSLKFYGLSRDNETIRKAVAKKKDFCSGYGMSDPFEDFAECFNLYINHNAFFKWAAKTDTVLKNKYNFIAAVFKGQYISSNSWDTKLLKPDTTRRARDTTKLSN